MNDDRIVRIEDKIDKVKDTLGEINVTLASQHVSLDEHIRRTAALEKEIKPIKKHVDIVNFIGKLALAVLLSDVAYELGHAYFKVGK